MASGVPSRLQHNSVSATVSHHCLFLVQLPTMPDHVWYESLTQMPLKDCTKLYCVSSSLTAAGSAWEQLRSLMVWSAKVQSLWYNITQIRTTILTHRRVARDALRSALPHCTNTLNELATQCDTARKCASRVGNIIKPLRQTFERLCDELQSLLSQYPQSDPCLVAFEKMSAKHFWPMS